MIHFQLKTDSDLIRQAFEASLMYHTDADDLSADFIQFELTGWSFTPDILPPKLMKYMQMSNRILKDFLYITKHGQNITLLVTDLARRKTVGYFKLLIHLTKVTTRCSIVAWKNIR